MEKRLCARAIRNVPAMTLQTKLNDRLFLHSGDLIEICVPELKSGEQAEVIIMLPITQQSNISTLKSVISKGKGCFASLQQADFFIRKERDVWE